MASIGSSILPIQEGGNHLSFSFEGSTTPSGSVTLISQFVPVGKKWRIRRFEGQCRGYGYFSIFINSDKISKSFSSPANENPFFEWSPYRVADSLDLVEVVYNQGNGPVLDLTGFLFITEV